MNKYWITYTQKDARLCEQAAVRIDVREDMTAHVPAFDITVGPADDALRQAIAATHHAVVREFGDLRVGVLTVAKDDERRKLYWRNDGETLFTEYEYFEMDTSRERGLDLPLITTRKEMA